VRTQHKVRKLRDGGRDGTRAASAKTRTIARRKARRNKEQTR
jgi:hypothetical protein